MNKTILLTALLMLPFGARAADLPSQSVYHAQATLTNQHGQRFEWQSLQGKVVVVSMFYGNCHFMCPLILQSARGVHKLVGKDADNVSWVMISLDPDHDTPHALSKVAADQHIEGPEWQLASPENSQQVQLLSSVLNVRYRKLPDGSFNHESALILLDHSGRVAGRTTVETLKPDAPFAQKIRSLLSQKP